MLKIKSIRLINYGSHENSFINLENISLLSILGEFNSNKDQSNGAGKSTILDAIQFALFGKGKFSKMAEIVRKENNIPCSDCSVNLIMEDSLNFIFEIKRNIEIKKKNNEFTFTGNVQFYINDELQAETSELTQSKIDKLINIDNKLFSASYFFGEGTTDLFTNTDPSSRRVYINSLFEEQLSIYNTIINNIKIKQNENDILLGVQKNTNAVIETELQERLNKTFEDKNENAIKFEISKLTEELMILEKNDSEIKRVEIQKQIDLLDSVYKSFKNKIKFAEDRLHNNQRLLEIKKEQISKLIFYRGIEIEKKKVDEEVETLINELNKQRLLYSPIKSMLTKFNSIQGHKCPTCFQQITSEYKETLLKELFDQEKELISIINKLEIEVEEKNIIQKDLNLKVENHKKNLIEHKNLTEAIKTYEKDIKEQQTFLDENQKELKTKQDEIIALQEQLDNIKDNDTEYLKLKLNQELSDLNRRYIEAIENRKEKELNDQKIKELKEKIDTIIKEQFETKKKSWIFDESIKVVKEAQNKASKYYLQTIEIETNFLLQKIDPQYHFIIEEKDNAKKDIELYLEVENNIMSYKRLSLGEKRLLDFSCRLAISSVLNSITHCQIGFVLIDEIFSNLDIFHQTQLVQLLIELKNKYSQIIILDHSPLLKSLIDETLIVVKENNISRIKE